MQKGIDLTIKILSQSKNQRALSLLDAAVSSSETKIRHLAGRELMAARGGRGVTAMIRRYDPKDPHLVEVFRENHDKSLPAIRSALISHDLTLARQALLVAKTQKYFELLPTLLALFMDRGEADVEDPPPLVETIESLMEDYVEALEERRNRRKLYEIILPEVLRIMYKGVREFHRKDPDLILHVFLSMYPYFPEDEEEELTEVLRNPTATAYLGLHKLLFAGKEPSVLRFFVHCMNRSNVPVMVLSNLAKRDDPELIAFFFHQADEYLSLNLRKNLGQVQSPAFLEKLSEILPKMDDQAQSGLVKSLPYLELTDRNRNLLLVEIYTHGSAEGRRKVIEAIARQTGPEYDRFLWNATDDKDPEVQAFALKMLQERNLPNVMTRILSYIDSPHQVVRETVQELLPEFRFSKYLDSFGQMNEAQRRKMFDLIKKLDERTVDEIARILMLGEPEEQAKVLCCVEYGNLVDATEDTLCAVASKGKTAELRKKAVQLLGKGRRELSRGTLVQVFHRDPAPEVREAAKKSLQSRPAPWEAKKEENGGGSD